jgi:hypothetical protein
LLAGFSIFLALLLHTAADASLGTPEQRFAGRPLNTREQVEAAIQETEAEASKQGVPLYSQEMQDLYAFLYERWYEVSLQSKLAACTTNMEELFPKAHRELTDWDSQIKFKTNLGENPKWQKRIRNAWRTLVNDVRREIEKDADRCPGSSEAAGRDLYEKMTQWGATGTRLVMEPGLNGDDESLAFFALDNIKRLACRKECLKHCRYIRLLNPQPSDGEKNVSVKVVPRVSSVNILEEKSVMEGTIVVGAGNLVAGGTTIPGPDGKSLFWRPNGELKKGTTYTVTVRKEASRFISGNRDADGSVSKGKYVMQELLDVDMMPLKEDYNWSFTTEGDEELKWCGTVTVRTDLEWTPAPTEPPYPHADHCTHTEHSAEHVTVRLTVDGLPGVQVDADGEYDRSGGTVCTARTDCRRSVWVPPELVDLRMEEGVHISAKGSRSFRGIVGVRVRVEGDKAQIRVPSTYFEVPGTSTGYSEGTLLCGEPMPRKEKSYPFTQKLSGIVGVTIETSFDPAKPDRLSGSKTIRETTYNWNLERKPAARCGGGK